MQIGQKIHEWQAKNTAVKMGAPYQFRKIEPKTDSFFVVVIFVILFP